LAIRYIAMPSTAVARLTPAGFIEPCLPTLAKAVPNGPQWAHEIGGRVAGGTSGLGE